MIKDGKLFGILNWFDMIVIVVLVCIMTFSVSMYMKNRNAVAAGAPMIIEFYLEEVGLYAGENIKEGDIVKDSLQNNVIGTVREVIIDDPIFWTPDSDGNILPAAKEGYCSLRVVVDTNGLMTDSGLSINSYNYYINKTTEIRAGSVALYSKVSNIAPANEG